MPRTLALTLALLPLAAQEPDLPLALNLPTTDQLGPWQPAIRFTHRFVEPAKGNPRDLYGWDGGNYAGVGLDLGIGGVPGLMAQVYRTSDGKALVLGLQQRLLSTPRFGAALRVERFDEGVRRIATSLGTLGISGTAVQMPLELRGGGLTVSLVPTWLSRSSTREGGFLTAGAGLRWGFGEHHAALAEYYPRPSRLEAGRFEQGWSIGYRYATRNHRFTVLATTANGSAAHQVLGGDYAGGPRPGGQWSFGFNLVRMF